MASSGENKRPLSIVITDPSQVILDHDEVFVPRERSLTVSKIRGEIKKNPELNSKKDIFIIYSENTLVCKDRNENMEIKVHFSRKKTTNCVGNCFNHTRPARTYKEIL